MYCRGGSRIPHTVAGRMSAVAFILFAGIFPTSRPTASAPLHVSQAITRPFQYFSASPLLSARNGMPVRLGNRGEMR